MPTRYTITIAGDICKAFMVYGLRGLDFKMNHSGNRGGREACGGFWGVLCSFEGSCADNQFLNQNVRFTKLGLPLDPTFLICRFHAHG